MCSHSMDQSSNHQQFDFETCSWLGRICRIRFAPISTTTHTLTPTPSYQWFFIFPITNDTQLGRLERLATN